MGVPTKDELIKDLTMSFVEVADWMEAQSIDGFLKGPENKWNTAQHIDHLAQTAKAINRALLLPKFFLKYKFGIANRPPKQSAEVIAKYQQKLLEIPDDFVNPMMPRTFTINDKTELLKAFNREGSNLSKKIGRWSDNQLDRYLLPHPLVGRMLIREFIVWTTYHNRHHLKILQKGY